jgi:DNA helicase II / ATP-dependent DNA helicase PcrA
MIDLAKHLNPSQFKAATTVDRPILVIAGAGSGKTRVIEYRVLHLIQMGVDPGSILLLTFTRKASRQMMERAASHDQRSQLIDGGTFHSFAFKLLKRYAGKIGLSNSFSILDQSDSVELVGKAVNQLDLYDIRQRFPKKETVQSIISKSINKQASVKHIVEREYPQFEELIGELEKVKVNYHKEKLNGDYVDYDDLLVYLKLLLEDPSVSDRLGQQYRHIMVDEYQDTNKLQGDVSYLLAKEHNNIMAVGDDAQSIYGFRGATHANIMEFPLKFANCEIIKLEQNYRSTQQILNLGNSVLGNLTKKYSKTLTSALEQGGDKPTLMVFKNPYDEASWIAEMIKKYRDTGLDFAKQAVLFRSAYISIALQTELSRRGIPYQMYGGLKFYETAHIKDFLSYLKIVNNYKDELAWLRILRLLEGVGPVTATKMFSVIRHGATFTQSLQKLEENYGSGSSFSTPIMKLVNILMACNASLEQTPADLMPIIFEYYCKIGEKTYDEWRLREADVQTVIEIGSRYSTIPDLLSDLALEPPERGVEKAEGAESEDEKPLVLSTIHSAKGLEWDVVFVIGLIDGVFPSRFSLKFSDQIEEEQRLLYVAVTRPKQKLYLTMHHEGSGTGFYQFNRLSRFLEHPSVLKSMQQSVITEGLDSPEVRQNQKKHDLSCENQVLTQDELSGKITDKKTLFEKLNDAWKWEP